MKRFIKTLLIIMGIPGLLMLLGFLGSAGFFAQGMYGSFRKSTCDDYMKGLEKIDARGLQGKGILQTFSLTSTLMFPGLMDTALHGTENDKEVPPVERMITSANQLYSLCLVNRDKRVVELLGPVDKDLKGEARQQNRERLTQLLGNVPYTTDVTSTLLAKLIHQALESQMRQGRLLEKFMGPKKQEESPTETWTTIHPVEKE